MSERKLHNATPTLLVDCRFDLERGLGILIHVIVTIPFLITNWIWMQHALHDLKIGQLKFKFWLLWYTKSCGGLAVAHLFRIILNTFRVYSGRTSYSRLSWNNKKNMEINWQCPWKSSSSWWFRHLYTLLCKQTLGLFDFVAKILWRNGQVTCVELLVLLSNIYKAVFFSLTLLLLYNRIAFLSRFLLSIHCCSLAQSWWTTLLLQWPLFAEMPFLTPRINFI